MECSVVTSGPDRGTVDVKSNQELAAPALELDIAQIEQQEIGVR